MDRNPELLESVGEAVERIGGGTGKMLAASGEAVEDVGRALLRSRADRPADSR